MAGAKGAVPFSRFCEKGTVPFALPEKGTAPVSIQPETGAAPFSSHRSPPAHHGFRAAPTVYVPPAFVSIAPATSL